MLLLLVDYYKTDILKRSENCAAGADNYIGLAAFDPLPLVEAFPDGKSAVKHRHSAAVAPAKERKSLRGEPYLRHHDYDGPARIKHLIDNAHIDRGLAAAGHAVEERDRSFARICERQQLIARRLLLVGQGNYITVRLGGSEIRQGYDLAVIEFGRSVADKGIRHGGGQPREVAKLLDTGSADILKHIRHLTLFFGQLHLGGLGHKAHHTHAKVAEVTHGVPARDEQPSLDERLGHGIVALHTERLKGVLRLDEGAAPADIFEELQLAGVKPVEPTRVRIRRRGV